MAVQDIARIEERIDKTVAGSTEVSVSVGGVRFQSMVEVMEFAKLMSIAGEGVPPHLRGNPGMCLAVCVQALEWRMSPFAVANKSYVVNNRIGYESQLVHAVIEQRAPLKGRIRHWYQGEGDERVCVVEGHIRGEAEPIRYQSPPFGKIQPKNSPLWKTKPDLQLYHNTIRDFGRVYFPDVILGVFAEEELRDSGIGPDRARDVTPKPDVASRLGKSKSKRGFDAEHVERETSGEARSPAGHGAAEGTEPVTGTGRPQQDYDDQGPLPTAENVRGILRQESTGASGDMGGEQTPSEASVVASGNAPDAGTEVEFAKARPPSANDLPVGQWRSGRDPAEQERGHLETASGAVAPSDAMAGEPLAVSAPSPANSEIARTTPAGGVEARAEAEAPPPSIGPPSIFWQYWDYLCGFPDRLAVRDATQKFIRQNAVPRDAGLRNKLMRIEQIRLNVLSGVYPPSEGEEKARAAIES